MASTLRASAILFILFAELISDLGAQSFSGILLDANTYERLPFGNIVIKNTKRGTTSDIEGRFHIPLLPTDSVLVISYAGYEKREINLLHFTCAQGCTIVLKPTSLLIGEVKVYPGENPALHIIRRIRESRFQNDPENLKSYYYKAYNKIIMGFDTNDLKVIKDSLQPEEVDSFALKAIEFANRQYLFISESVSERRYLNPGRVNETVLATRISGLKNPLFSILATQLQSFSFYRDEFEIFNISLDNPLSKKAENQYFFLIEDTLFDRKDADTVFIISFRPRPGHEHKCMKGLLYIAVPDYAITNVIASPGKEADFSVSIQQYYEKINNRWFPVQLNSDFKIHNFTINGLTVYGSMRSFHRDINLSPGLRLKDFRSVDIRINPDAGEKDSVYWSQFRVHDLTDMERRTYQFNDSVGEVLNLDKRVMWFTAFTDGKLRIKYIDLELNRILSYNVFEGFRTGLGLTTNERFHPRFQIGGFAGYGWRDHIWKYGYQASFRILEPYNMVIGGGYSYDMAEAAQPFFYFIPRRNLLESSARQLYITGWDYVSSVFGFMSWEWTPRLKNILRYNREFRKYGQKYFFINPDKGLLVPTNGFALNLLEYSLEYAPNDIVTETFLGRRRIRTTYPRYYFNFTQSVGNSNHLIHFTKFDARINHRLGRRRVGFLYTELAAGYLIGEAPLGYLYAGKANMYNGDNIRLRQFALADRMSFETMLYNEFLMDSFIHLMLRYDSGSLLFKRKPKRPHIEFVYRALFGGNAQSQLHLEVNNLPPSGIFQEAGVEFNRILSGIGVGIYYRISPSIASPTGGGQSFFLKLTTKQ